MNIQRPEAVPPRHFLSWDRLSEYAGKHGRVIDEQLGWGAEGLVYSTKSKTAVKAFLHANLYENEKHVYLRLWEHEITSVDAFAVPRILQYSDALMIVEMTIVSPPFILDFAGAYLDRKPPFDEDALDEWEREKIEQFGDRWSEVRSALSTLRGHGIYLSDVKPGNVTFAD
jgi:hypothetical protein